MSIDVNDEKNYLVVDNISFSYEDKKVIEDISFSLRKGEIISIIGMSGVGKTTLFNVIAGLLVPNRGEVYLKGENITGKSGKISYMLQKDLLLPFKTVFQNIALPLTIKGIKKKEARILIEEKIKDFGLEEVLDKYPDSLSGGMRQRAALLRTYLFSSDVALLDEPFSALDSITKDSMHSWYLHLRENLKLSTIFITHDIDEAIKLSDRIFVLSGSPGHLNKPLEVDIPMPRTFVDKKFIELKYELLKIINGDSSFT